MCANCAATVRNAPLSFSAPPSRSSSASSKRSRTELEEADDDVLNDGDDEEMINTDEEDTELDLIKNGKADYTMADMMRCMLENKRETKRTRKENRKKYAHLTAELSEVRLIAEEAKAEVKVLKDEQSQHKEQIKALNQKVARLEAANITELRIAGHPMTEKEARKEKSGFSPPVLEVAKAAGIPMLPLDVKFTRYLPPKKTPTTASASSSSQKSTPPPSFVVIFHDPSLCTRLLVACTHPHVISIKSEEDESCRIYVNTLLRKEFTTLFKKVQDWAHTNHWEHAWHKRSTIYVRKENGSKAHIISEENGLVDLLKVQNDEKNTKNPSTKHQSQVQRKSSLPKAKNGQAHSGFTKSPNHANLQTPKDNVSSNTDTDAHRTASPTVDQNQTEF